MVLEALAAAGLASNIVQFIEFGCNLLAESRELHLSTTGSLDRNIEFETISKRLKYLTDKLTSTISQSGSAIEENLMLIAADGSAVANELLQAIEEVKMKTQHGKWGCFVHALRHIWKNKRIEKMAGKLESLQLQINTYMLGIMR